MDIKKLVRNNLNKILVNEEFKNGELFGYHVTNLDNISSIEKNGLKIGHKDMQGKGLYAFYNLNDAIDYLIRNGSNKGAIVKFKIVSPDRLLILNMDVAKKVFGDKYHLINQISNKYWDGIKGIDGLLELTSKTYNPNITKDELIEILENIEKNNTQKNQNILWAYLLPKRISDELDLIFDGEYGLEYRINHPKSLVNTLGYYEYLKGKLSDFINFKSKDIIPNDKEYADLKNIFNKFGNIYDTKKYIENKLNNARSNKEYDYYDDLYNKVNNIILNR